MKTFSARVRNGLQRWLGGHLSLADCLAFQDKELNSRRARRIEGHLASCESCRTESKRLVETFDLFLKVTAPDERPPSLTEGLTRLQQQIHDWRQTQETQTATPVSPTAETVDRWQRVFVELAAYLGPQIAARLVEAARQSSQEVRGILRVARPLLTGLLGERAAFHVTTQLFKIFTPERTVA